MDKPTRIAVIGAGHWGPNLIRNFHTSQRSEVAWVVDRDAGRRAQVEKRFPGMRTSDDAAVAIGDASVDAVVVATPTVTHYEIAKAALEAGKHVLVEKPIATTAAHGEELCRLADDGGLTLVVGHVFLFNGAVRRVKQYLSAGELGAIYYISMVRTNLGPIRVDVNAAWDLAAHDISIVSYWLDMQPESASAIGGTWINEGNEDAMFATLRYPSGVLVNLHVSWLNPRKARDITVVGDRRMLTFDDMSIGQPIRLYDKQVTDDTVQPGFVDTFASYRASVREGDIIIPKVAGSEPLRDETEHFLDCIASGERSISDGRLGLSVVKVLEAMDRSAQNAGREERVEK